MSQHDTGKQAKFSVVELARYKAQAKLSREQLMPMRIKSDTQIAMCEPSNTFSLTHIISPVFLSEK